MTTRGPFFHSSEIKTHSDPQQGGCQNERGSVCQTEPQQPLLTLPNMATTRTLVNASTTGTYRTNHQQVRPGADQHRQHKSYGVLT